MGGIPTNRFGSSTGGAVLNGGGAVWDLGGAAGMVDLTGWQYTDALSEASSDIAEGMADPQDWLEWQGRQPQSWQFPPLWRSLIDAATDAARENAHLISPHLLRPTLYGAVAGNLLLSQPLLASAELIAAGGFFAAGGAAGDASSGGSAPVGGSGGGDGEKPRPAAVVPDETTKPPQDAWRADIDQKIGDFLAQARGANGAMASPLDGVDIHFHGTAGIIYFSLNLPKAVDSKDPAMFGDWLCRVSAIYSKLAEAVSRSEHALGYPFLMPTMSAEAKTAVLDYLLGLRREGERIFADALQELETGRMQEFLDKGFARSGRLHRLYELNNELQPLSEFDRSVQSLRHSQQSRFIAIVTIFNRALQQAQRGQVVERWWLLPHYTVESRLSAIAFVSSPDALEMARHRLRLETTLDISPALKGLPLEKPISELLEKVAGNLLSNAAKYADSKKSRPAIWIKAGLNERGEIVLEVRDNGIGMSEAELARVGEHGWRSDRVKGHIRGEGVGIASVKADLSKVGGRLDVASNEGEGTTWTAYIPLAAKPTEKEHEISFVGQIDNVPEELLAWGARRLQEALSRVPSLYSRGVAAVLMEVITGCVNSRGLLDSDRAGTFRAHIETKAAIIERMGFLLRLIRPYENILTLILSPRGPLYVASDGLRKLLFYPGQFARSPSDAEAAEILDTLNRTDELFTEEVIKSWLRGRDIRSVAGIGIASLLQLMRVSRKFDMEGVMRSITSEGENDGQRVLRLAELIVKKFTPAGGRALGGVTVAELEREIELSLPEGTNINPQSPLGRFLDRMRRGETVTIAENNVVYHMLEEFNVLGAESPAARNLYHRLATVPDAATVRFAIGGRWNDAVVEAELHELALFVNDKTMSSEESIENVFRLIGLLGRYKSLGLDKASPNFNFDLEKAKLYLPLVEWAGDGRLLPVTYTVEEVIGERPGVPVIYARLDGLMERLETLLREHPYDDVVVGLPPIDEVNVNLDAFQGAIDSLVTRTGFEGRLMVLDIKNMIAYLKEKQ